MKTTHEWDQDPPQVSMGAGTARLRARADQCRRLARAMYNPVLCAELEQLAREFDERARALDRAARDGTANDP